MLRLCPYHGLEPWLIIPTFYNGLLYKTKLTLDTLAGDTLMDKPYEDTYQLIKNMAQIQYQWGGEKTSIEKPLIKCRMYKVNDINHVNAKVDTLTKKISNLTVTPAATVTAATSNRELYGTPGHNTPECHLLAGISTDQVSYAQGNPYSNTYNPGWRNHPNFSYKSNNTLFAPNRAPVIPPGYQKGASASPQAPRKVKPRTTDGELYHNPKPIEQRVYKLKQSHE